MKKVMNTAITYLLVGLAGVIYFRELTKFHDFTGNTALGVVHTHALMLGVGVFLLVALFLRQTSLAQNALYPKFFVLYNLALPLMLVTLAVRGTLQVLGTTLSRSAEAALAGIAGLSHIGVGVALLLLLLAIKKEMMKQEEQ